MGKREMMNETARLIVRPFREKDAGALYRIRTDPQVMEYCPDFLSFAGKIGDREAESRLRSWIDCFARP